MGNNQYFERVQNQYRKSIAMLAGTALAGLVALYADDSKRSILEGPKPAPCEQLLGCRYYEKLERLLE